MSSSEPFDSTQRADASKAGGPRPKASGEQTTPAVGKDLGPPPPPGDPLLGAELGGCRIESLLGRGAMGAVYKARQLRLDREVALKVIRPELLSDPRVLKRFEVEARTVGRFNSPHVVMVHDVGFERGVHFLVMEFVRGKNLRDHTKLLAGGRMPVAEAIPLLRQACKGLEEAQRLGVLHRDIKPDNLMLTERGVLKIADFGIARPAEQDFSMTLTSELIGTPLYMSPEQCQAAPDLDYRSDMYSLGATFYYLLTGEPPIRASSVYELIQTKTKLEHLSLWKALPELDENHPLSRVIERMTALDRGDRYESYEQLVGDLVLVQQGRTMEIQRLKQKQAQSGKGKVAAGKPRSGRAAAVAGLLVVGLLGGGFAWLQWGPQGGAAPGTTPPTVGEPVNAGAGSGRAVASEVPAVPAPAPAAAPEPAEVGRQVEALRARLAEHGPAPALRADIAALAVDETHAQAKQALLADLDLGMPVRARLQAVGKPTTLELPFTDLEAHLAGVGAAAAVAGTPGPELQRWLQAAVTAARAEDELGLRAVTALIGAFSTWQADRMKVATDVPQLAALGQRLDGIDAARRKLLELLPNLHGSLQQSLPLDVLESARRGLVAENPVPVAADAGPALQEIRAGFAAEGPVAALRSRLESLRPLAAEQVEQRSQLLNAFQAAGNALDAARAARLKYPEARLPFEDVASYFAAIDRELSPLQQPEVGLPLWAQKEREELRDEATLQAKVLQSCRAALADWQGRRQQPNVDGVGLSALGADLTLLQGGLRAARTLFPAIADDLGAIEAQAGHAATGLAVDLRRQQWLADAKETLRKFGVVTTLADWRLQAKQWGIDWSKHRADAADFAADADVQGELQRAAQIGDRWAEADKRVLAVQKALAAGDLTGAEAAARVPLPGAEGRDEFRMLGDAAATCLAAFTELDSTLDIPAALAKLREARTALSGNRTFTAEALVRIERWITAVQALQTAAAGMVPVAAGRTKAGVEVPAFLLGRTEVKQADYQRFLEEVQAVVAAAGTEIEAQREALRPRLGDYVPPADVLQRMLGRRTKLNEPDMPIDEVTWYAAAACAAWQRLSLPTEAEWALAAFGDGHEHDWPWGGKAWKDTVAARNIGSALMAVESGGKCWREGVFHLAGNAAEWLDAPIADEEAALAGGSYRDNGVARDARRRAAGEEFSRVGKKKNLPGFGFRLILRPRLFLAPDFAGGKFPIAR